MKLSKRPAIFANDEDDADENNEITTAATTGETNRIELGQWLQVGGSTDPSLLRSMVFPDLRRGWSASLRLGNGSCLDIGSFPTKSQAELSYDVQALSLYGLTPTKNINTEIELTRAQHIRLIRSGSESRIELFYPYETSCQEGKAHSIVIDPVSTEQEYKILPSEIIAQRSFGGDVISKVVSDNITIGADYSFSTPWKEAVFSAFTQITSFAYEVTFNHQNSLGLNLKSHCIPYALGSSKRQFGSLLVVEANALGTIIRPGDLLIKVNKIELASGDMTFNFENATRQITKESAPRVVRFLRPGTAKISPAEVQLYMSGAAAVLAKFQYVISSGHPCLQLIHLEENAPYAVKSLMQAKRLQWEYPGPIAQGLIPASSKSSLPSNFPPFLPTQFPSTIATILTKRALLQSLHSGPYRVYRDHGKWVVIIEHQSRLYYLGRYDTEDDALAVYKKYTTEIERTGIFVSKRQKRGFNGTVAELYCDLGTNMLPDTSPTETLSSALATPVGLGAISSTIASSSTSNTSSGTPATMYHAQSQKQSYLTFAPVLIDI